MGYVKRNASRPHKSCPKPFPPGKRDEGHGGIKFIPPGNFLKFMPMENASPLDEKLQILKKIEDIGNRDFDGVDVTKLLKGYLHASDPEIILSALQAASNYAADESLFQEIHKMAQDCPEEEIRAMANSCLGAVIQDGLEYEETLPTG